MQSDNTAPPTTSDIRLDIISMHEWRVCDRRYPERDARCVLGFIEREQFTYHATHIQPSGSVENYGSLATATASFSVD
ncbi:hypothetical protein IWX81_000181 [Salinibacterium sp. CAN_S4]|uniref:hypothetical protein n=1 Tax=Salinibacterium sp. CAN_S4 TaxID=2787727 RepID=UPI0018EFD7AE